MSFLDIIFHLFLRIGLCLSLLFLLIISFLLKFANQVFRENSQRIACSWMKSGTIINISSVSGVAAGYRPHACTAAKFGVVELTKSVALELAERGIRVNAICPGGIATAIYAPIGGEMSAELIERTPDIVEPWLAEVLPLGRAGFPVEIANAALWLASSESNFVTGHALTVDAGLTAGRTWSHMLSECSDELVSVLTGETFSASGV